MRPFNGMKGGQFCRHPGGSSKLGEPRSVKAERAPFVRTVRIMSEAYDCVHVASLSWGFAGRLDSMESNQISNSRRMRESNNREPASGCRSDLGRPRTRQAYRFSSIFEFSRYEP